MGGEADAARRTTTVDRQRRDGGVDVGHGRSQPRQEPFAGLGRGDGAGRAMQQPHVQARLHRLDPVAEGRGRDAQRRRRAAEAPRLDNGGEDGQVAPGFAIH